MSNGWVYSSISPGNTLPGEEALTAIAQALDLGSQDLQQGHLPEARASWTPGKEALDKAIAGCEAWLKVYHQENMLLDRARTDVKLAELSWERMRLTEDKTERERLLTDASENIEKALPIFRTQAPGSYEEAQVLRATIERERHVQDLDDAIAGCKALLQVSRQAEQPLDWARTHPRLAQLYWDRAMSLDQPEERPGWLGKALQCIDQALPLFQNRTPVSSIQAQQMRAEMKKAREEALHAFA